MNNANYTSLSNTDYLRFNGLKIGRKTYEVILTITNGVHNTEVYLITRNGPPKYLPNPGTNLLTQLDALLASGYGR